MAVEDVFLRDIESIPDATPVARPCPARRFVGSDEAVGGVIFAEDERQCTERQITVLRIRRSIQRRFIVRIIQFGYGALALKNATAFPIFSTVKQIGIWFRYVHETP